MFFKSHAPKELIATLLIITTLLERSNCVPVAENKSAINSTTSKDDLTTEWAKQIMRRAKAAEIHGMLDTNVDPCDNFYQYACGNWHRGNPAQLLKHVMTDRFQVIAKAFDRRLKLMLEEPRDENNQLDIMVKNFYEACKLVPKDQIRYKVALQHAYKEFGKVPLLDGEDWKESDFNWWETAAKMQYKYGEQIIFAVDIMADVKNNTGNNIYIGPTDFGIKSNTKLLRLLQKMKIIKDLQQYFNVESALAKKAAEEMVDFERRLVYSGTNRSTGITQMELLKLRPVKKLKEMYNESIDMERFLALALGDNVPESIYVYDEKYIESALLEIAETPKRVVANYIHWTLLQNYLTDIKVSDASEQCLDKTRKHFGKLVDYMVYQRYKSEAIEREVYDMWEQIRGTLREELRGDKLDWISNATREYAIEKLDNIQLYINSYENENFTSEYENVDISRNNYVENVQQIQMMEGRKKLKRLNQSATPLEAPDVLSFTPAYNLYENNIKIPVALMQPRYFWGDAYPTALKYATLGHLIAHEMVHAFDDEGRHHDKYGNQLSWWDDKSTYEFDARRKCFQAQYHSYSYGGRLLPDDPSQSENIADNAAVRLAYGAYMRWLRVQRLNDTEIDNKETFTQLQFDNKQLFFIAYAQLWCDDVQTFFKYSFASSDTHAPSMYRVVGSLSNFQEFSWVFKCKSDAPMDPEYKCAIY